MSRWTAVQKTYAMCRRLSALRGGGVVKYFLDALSCSVRHGASPENYFVLRFFELSEAQRREYLTSGRSKAVDRALNLGARADEKQILGRKSLFDRHFAGLVKRDFVFAAEADFTAFDAFLDRHPAFILKPDAGTMGRGIEKRRSADVWDREAFFHACAEKRLLLEEPIRQHPELDRINPACLNSVRINAARRKDGAVRLIGACLKCGVGEQISDNFHAGGIAYPVDLDSGRVSGPGRNNRDLTEYGRHPGTELYMPGFQLPCWAQVSASVLRGMELVPSLGYVGWDVAVGLEGPELIEGNYSWPGGNIIQFDGVGKYPIILSCLGE